MNIPRRHHYVSQFYLAGFTNTGTKEGLLWATDLERGRYWQCRPNGVAHSRDFYCVDIPDVDPFVIERELGKLEGDVNTILVEVLKRKQFKGDTDLSLLLNFMALQMTKTPAMRENLAKPIIAVTERVMDLMLETPERYTAMVEEAKKAGYLKDVQEVSYAEMKACVGRKGITVATSQNWNVKTALEMADMSLPYLHQRHWSLIEPENSNDLFVCSDHPVSLTWKNNKYKGQPPGLGMRETVVFVPLSSNLALQGVFEDDNTPLLLKVGTKQVASYNKLTFLNSYEQIYSSEEKFKIIDREGALIEVSLAQLASNPHGFLKEPSYKWVNHKS